MTVEIISGGYAASSPSVSATAACYLTKKVLRYNKGAYDDDYEGVYLGTDGIGLGAGAFYVDSNGTLSLHSSNFMIGSETSNGTTTTYLRFNNSGDGETTYIDDVHITTPTMICTALSSTTGNLTTAYIGDVTIEDEEISCGGTSINMNQGGTTISVTATVAQESGYSNKIKLTLSQSISCKCSFVVAYTYGFTGGNRGVDIITVPANTTSVTQTFDGGFWGVRSVYFPSTSSSTLTFSHKTSAAIEITGDLLPSNTSYILGSSTYPWSAVYSQSVITPSIGSSTGSVAVSGDLLPSSHKGYSLGNSNCAWLACWADSDKKKKQNIKDVDLEFALSIINNLSPKSFEYKKDIGKQRYGFIAQEVESALEAEGISAVESGIICKTFPEQPDGDNNYYALDYQEFIALIVKALQYVLNKIDT